MDTEEAPSPSGERTGIMIVVIVTALRAVLIGLGLLVSTGLTGGEWFAEHSPVPLYPIESAIGLISRGLLVGMLVLSLLCIWGLVRRHEWGWTLSIVTAGAILALNLGWWVSGDPHYLSMLVNSVLVFYLNQRDLRVAFGVGAT